MVKVYTVMDHTDFLAPVLRKAAGLEMGRRDVPVRLLKGEMQISIFHSQLRLLFPTTIGLEFEVKIGVETELVVKELLVAKHWRIGPNRLQEKRFTPPWMGTNQIRRESLRLKLLSRTGTALGTDDLGFSFNQQGMKTICVTAIEAVTEVVEALWNSTPAIQLINAQCHQVMLTLLGQPPNDVDVLPGEVLMNEKNSH